MKAFALTMMAAAMLTACGGSSNNETEKKNNDDIKLSGQVVDGPIAEAKVCLFSGGSSVKNKAGADVCSAETDEEGNYTLVIPGSISSGILHLVAAKGDEIRLASVLGSLEDVKKYAKKNILTPADLSSAVVTHFTTADFVIADTDNDGFVSEQELAGYTPDADKVIKVASIIKAVVDFRDQATDLIGGDISNTLDLAKAAASNEKLGSSNKNADEWLSAPENRNILAEVNKDAAQMIADSQFSNYEIAETVANGTNEGTISGTHNGNTATMFCQTGPDEDEPSPVQISLDAQRRMAVIKFKDDEGKDGQIVGSYDPQSQSVKLKEYQPKSVSMRTDQGLVYSSTSTFSMNGTYVPATGTITGTFDEETTNSWNLDNRSVKCTASGTFVATKK